VDTWSANGTSEPEGGYWPKWLAADLPQFNYYTLGYPASVFAQWAKKEMNLYQRSINALEILAGYNFGNRPLVFICHSLGGLLVKQIIRTARDSTDQSYLRIAESIKGILFLATPHNGSSLANLLRLFSGCFSSTHVEKLSSDSSDLNELNASFRSFCESREIYITSYHEMFKTRGASIVVDEKSADPGVKASIPIPVDADHAGICKPGSRSAIVYLSVSRKLKEWIPSTQISSIVDQSLFEDDQLEEENPSDRRDLLEKMSSAGREHEYSFANESQNKFARSFISQGLKTTTTTIHRNLLADIEQRFQSLIYHPLICSGADTKTILAAVQTEVITPLAIKYAENKATEKTIRNALYFLTERCHIRWDKS